MTPHVASQAPPQSAPANRQLAPHTIPRGTRILRLEDARASPMVRFTCSARTTSHRSGKGTTPNGPGRLPSCLTTLWCRASYAFALSRVVAHRSTSSFVTSNDSARSMRTRSPCLCHGPRQRGCGFLQARSSYAGFPCELPTPTTRDASDRLLPLYTLTTSTCASIGSRFVSKGLRLRAYWGNGVFHDTQFASAGLDRLCLHRAAFSSAW